MQLVFADACYWIALLVEQDELYKTAMLLHSEMGGRRIVTTEMVLAEALNVVGRYGEVRRRAAVDLVQGLRNNTGVDVIEQTPQQFWEAVAFYAARPDQEWGLVDCASFLIMTDWGIREALTNDHHFEQAGFTILMQ